MRDTLRWHNPAARLRVPPQDHRGPVETLLSAIEDDETDLLVMGGYTHSRLRAAVFGGLPCSVLCSSGVPLLMMH